MEVDAGHGGGQLLRTALSISALSGKLLSITNIRKNRPKPGLAAQHLACVQALAKITNAKIKGAHLGSTVLRFEPGRVQSGDFAFDIGTAGSTSLLLQCLLPPLLFANGETMLSLNGGTDVPFAPPSFFLSDVFLPAIRAMDANVALKIVRHGFYPKGGGSVRARIRPLKQLKPFAPQKPGPLFGRILSANLPAHVAEREAAVLKQHAPIISVDVTSVRAAGPGNTVFLGNGQNGVCALGKMGMPAEAVAREAWEAWQSFQQSGAQVETHLADQLVLYAALAHDTSEFSVSASSDHLATNAEWVQRLLNADVSAQGNTVRIAGTRWKNNDFSVKPSGMK